MTILLTFQHVTLNVFSTERKSLHVHEICRDVMTSFVLIKYYGIICDKPEQLYVHACAEYVWRNLL